MNTSPKMKDLVEALNYSMQVKKKYFAIAVTLPDTDEVELIINTTPNFQNKLDYYMRSYDENLIHNMNAKIRIVAFTYGDNLAQIEYDLM